MIRPRSMACLLPASALALLACLHAASATRQCAGPGAPVVLTTSYPVWWHTSPHIASMWSPATPPSIIGRDADFLSQNGEDRFAWENFFHGRVGGSYLEMGALDGKTFSNTWLFHSVFGWRGVLIEANPLSYKKLITNRPADICVHAAACGEARVVHWAERADHPAVNGVYEFMSTPFKTQWYPTVNVDDLAEISCLPLSAIFGTLRARHFNFFSLDVEGAELDVLRSIDFSCLTFDVVTVEDNGDSSAITELLEANGYEAKGKVATNFWFVSRRFVPVAKPSA